MKYNELTDDLLEDVESYDPLAADDLEEEAEEAYEAAEELREDALHVDVEIPAYDRTKKLFESMPARRRTLKAIVLFCKEAQSSEALNTKIDELQIYDASVYTPAALTSLLEQAGALLRVTETGEAYPTEIPEPELVEIDGQSYYETPEMPEIYWLASADALQYLVDTNTEDALKEAIQNEPQYREVYQKLFALMAQEGGATLPQLSDAVDTMDVMKKPRVYAPYFLGKLETLEAIEWKNAWCLTDLGKQVQSMLQ